VRNGFLYLLLAATLAGCSGSIDFGEFGFGDSGDEAFHSAGEELIEGELADRIGLGPLTATCEGENLLAGDSFQCSATTPRSDPIEFTASINGEADGVNIVSTNLLLADQIEQVEAFAASLIEQRTSTTIGAENFECADSSVVVAAGGVLDCRVTDPADGMVYEAPVTIDDLIDLSVTVNVGDPIP
jgi:hypothetical protein